MEKDYTVIAPDGTELTIVGPAGASPAQIRAAAEAAFKARGNAAPASPDPMSRMGRLGMGLADPIQGGAQLLTKMLPDSVVNAGNAANNWLAENTGLVAKLPPGGVDQQTREREARYERQKPEGFDWMRLLGNVASPVNLALGGAGAAAQAATLPAKVATAAATGGAAASLAPVTQGDDFAAEKRQQIGTGAAFGGATPAAVGAVSRLVSPRASTNAANQLLAAEGIRPTIGQSLGGMANRIEEKATSLPLLGDAIVAARGRASSDLNAAVANRALAPIGETAPKGMIGRELVGHVRKKIGEGYDNLLPKLTVKADDAFNADIASLRGMVSTGSINPNAAKLFERIVQGDVLGKFRGQQALTGPTFKNIESSLNEKASRLGGSADPDARLVADALREVQSTLRELAVRTNPKYAAELKANNTAWANFKRLEKAAGYTGAEDGVFNAAQLQGAVRALDRSKDKGRFARGEALMQDLSDAAKGTLGAKVPDSGTAGRLMNLPNVATAGAALAEPMTLGIPLLGAAAYSNPIQSLLRLAATARPAAAQPVAGLLNKTAPMLGPAGGLFGVQIAE